MAISINPYASPKIITVLAATSITIQNLVNWVMDWEEIPANLTHERVVKAGGKQSLGDSAKVGITAVLLNAKVGFEAQGVPTTCTIYGGNLVAVDANGTSMSPIEPATNVTVALAQSSSPTLIQDVAEWTQAEKDALPGMIWDSSDRKLTSRDVDSQLPGEHLSSEEQVEEVKGTGFDSNRDALVKIQELISSASKPGFQV